jgi:hypothetical protein
MSRTLALGLALLVALTACAWERTNRLGPITPWPPRDGVQKPLSLALRIYGTRRFEGAPGDLAPPELAVWRDEALRAYGESQLFSSVAATWEPKDLVAEISISKSTGPRKGVSFYFGVLMFRQTDIEMRTRFRRPDGSLLSLVELSEAIRTFEIFTPPEGESEDSLRVILYDLHRATLSQAARAGILRLDAEGEPETEEKS